MVAEDVLTMEQLSNLLVYVDEKLWTEVLKQLALNAIMRCGAHGAVVIKVQKVNQPTTRQSDNILFNGCKSRDKYRRSIEMSEKFLRIEFFDSGFGMTEVIECYLCGNLVFILNFICRLNSIHFFNN